MKQKLEDNLSQFKDLIYKYHKTLDLMSNQGLASLDEKIIDALIYAETITELSSQITSPSILDVGSGVGLPGIVLGLYNQKQTVILAERRKKRVTFLKILISQLNLSNVEVFEGDVKTLRGKKFEFITAQAFGAFELLYSLTKNLQTSPCFLLSRKGENWQAEANDLAKAINTPIETLSVKPLSSHGSLITVKVTGGINANHRHH